MGILDEIENEVWFILTSIYTHQRMVENITNIVKNSTRYELANQFVAMDAVVEILIIRIARLADKTKGMRTISMLVKHWPFQKSLEQVKLAADDFLALAKPIVKIRHEEIAHMKPGICSNYDYPKIPTPAIKAAESLVRLIDIARGQQQTYAYRVGSMEAEIDLRASLVAGKMVTVAIVGKYA
ncbi:Uncharacterised protein [Serratia liquefaciens]|uniref:hypothetical protein n=1 Tax=Serratia liquefaciens TaxID=614 RepID=UPI00217B8C23|nr:hypothetical protein [Serratia liquefaciens]CAI0996110.1 Uncharacterised protein [Serratia liquefaciens]CAI1521526.1 Uncharacterised protein [Serratia liquefaciens]